MRFRSIERLQNRAAAAFGLEPARRVSIVRGMLEPHPGDALGYWLQLLIATVLATFGLAVGSTAVVIGAMLIAPLMRPIVDLAMGLATGSAPLVLGAVLRTTASVVTVVLVSTMITRLLPFHDVTSELSARTAPSLLDLFVAAACALAGAYAVMAAESNMATTAAGTSIGISLVPPLCTTGYGLATSDTAMAAGAALLFTANIAGILGVCSALFVVTGFGQVDVLEEEKLLDDHAQASAADRFGRSLSRRSQHLGAMSRLVLPLLLVAAIFVPLRRAVGDMTRRSRIRAAIESELSNQGERLVQHSLDITAHELLLRVVVMGSDEQAHELEEQLRARLAHEGVTAARIAVWALPEAAELRSLVARIDQMPRPPPTPTGPRRPDAAAMGAAVHSAWSAGAGPIVAVWIDADRVTRVHVIHIGPPLGQVGRELLARAIDPTATTEVSDEALAPVEAAPDESRAWLVGALQLAGRTAGLSGLHLCVTMPPPPAPRRRPPPTAAELALVEVRTTVEATLAGRAELVDGDRWQIRPSLAPCTPPVQDPPSPPSDQPADPAGGPASAPDASGADAGPT